VLLQQGRVLLDSDAGEQTAIAQYYLRSALTDIIGRAGCPSGPAGIASNFGISQTTITNGQPDLVVSPGRCYVDGILAETVQPAAGGTARSITYLTQPDGYLDPSANTSDGLPAAGSYIVYLRVWERSVTALQDPDIREVALGIHGPDTTGRAQVVWQIAYVATVDDAATALDQWKATFWQDAMFGPAGTLQAMALRPADAETDVCSISPRAQYRGRENQLYRVEIFRGTSARLGRSGGSGSQNAYYVWSRDNGSTVFAIESLAGAEVTTVGSLGRDARSGLETGDFVEIADDASASRVADERDQTIPRKLFQVTAIDAVNRIVTLDSDPSASIGGTGADPRRHPLLRRWDSAMRQVTEGNWLPIEDGVQVQFPGSGVAGTLASYRTGDYWLIPARTVLADVIWPQDASGPKALPPAGVAYHYAPLAFVQEDGTITDLRPTFDTFAKWPPLT
jgi:hypothetical protein